MSKKLKTLYRAVYSCRETCETIHFLEDADPTKLVDKLARVHANTNEVAVISVEAHVRNKDVGIIEVVEQADFEIAVTLAAGLMK